MDANQVLTECITNAATELLGFYDITAERAPGPVDVKLLAVIGFASPPMSGAVGVCCDAAVMRAIWPNVIPMSANEDAFAEPLGELGNQLIGRIKSQLSQYSVDIQLSVPMVLKGQDLGLVRGVGRVTDVIQLQTTHGQVGAWISCTVDPAFGFEKSEQDQLAHEGDFVAFF